MRINFAHYAPPQKFIVLRSYRGYIRMGIIKKIREKMIKKYSKRVRKQYAVLYYYRLIVSFEVRGPQGNFARAIAGISREIEFSAQYYARPRPHNLLY